MIIIGIITSLGGIFLLAAAWRGRVVALGQYCGACKFDLAGLELSRNSLCPECAQPTIPGTSLVISELRKPSRRLGFLSLLLILMGVFGLAWPIPSIKNFDWYAVLPESLLLKLEADGSDKALQELHSRLMPGTLSNDGLQSLIARSLAVVEDESVVWDERWGDVLLYGFFENKMSSDDVHVYLKNAFELSVEMDTSIDTFDTYADYIVTAEFSDRVAWSQRFWKQWYRVHGYQYNPVRVTINDSIEFSKHQPQMHKLGEFSIQIPWDVKYISKYKLKAYIPIAHHMDSVRGAFNQEFVVELDQSIMHSWTVQKGFLIMRESNGRTREQAVLDSMAMDRVNVYTQIEIAQRHRLRYARNEPINILLGSAEQYILFGEVYFRVGAEELYYGTIDWTIQENLTKDLTLRSPRYNGEADLDLFENNASFWDQAINTGIIDVIIRPFQGEKHKSSFTQRPIVFQGLAVEKYSPEVSSSLHRDSRGNEQWNWIPENRFPSIPMEVPISARFLDDE